MFGKCARCLIGTTGLLTIGIGLYQIPVVGQSLIMVYGGVLVSIVWLTLSVEAALKDLPSE